MPAAKLPMPTLRGLLDQPHKLPTIPRVAQELMRSFSDEDVSFPAVAAQISADPVLSAKLLRLANSAYFHFSRTIGSVDDALRMLGFVMVRNLVLGNGLAAAFRNTRGMDLREFWHYNLYTACAARWLAAEAGVQADTVFTVGLMHGIGQLHLHAAAAEAMAPLDRRMDVLEAGRAALERQELGFHHGDVAAELARCWHFPEPIAFALCQVPLPLEGREFSDMAACVHLGAWRARAELRATAPEERAAAFPEVVARRLGLSLEAVDARMPVLAELTEGLQAMLE